MSGEPYISLAAKADEMLHLNEEPELFRVVDMAQPECETEQSWFWQGYIPAGHATLIGGHGGAGKSTLGVHLLACIGAGADAFGRKTEQARTLYFSGEDPAALVLKRLRRVCRRLDLSYDQVRQWVQIVDASDLHPVLFTERRIDGQRCGTTTPTYAALAKYIEREGFDVLIVDNASDTFDADEINRAMVRSFIRSLMRLVPRAGAVLLLAHVDKATSRAGKLAGTESYSGSTAWHNAVRSRLFLLETAPGELELQHQKSNLGMKLPPLRLEWPQDGVLQAPEQGGFVAAIEARNDMRTLIAMLHEFATRGEQVTTATTSRTNAALLFAREKRFPRHLKANDVFGLLRDAERAKLIRREEHKGADRKARERWALTFEGCALIGVAATAATAATTQVTAPIQVAAEAAATAATPRGGYGGTNAHKSDRSGAL